MDHLPSQAWLVAQPQWLLLVMTAASVAALVKGADWLVDAASDAAYRFGISKVIVGATIVSLGTTSPEAAVSVQAAWAGESGLALGNAVGSIIVDSGLIFGVGCLMAELPADRFVLSRQGWVQFGAGMLLAAVCYGSWLVQGPGAVIGRGVGVALLALLAVYMWVSVKWSREHPAGEPFQMDADGGAGCEARRPMIALCALGIMGLLLVLLSSRVLIGSVAVLAEHHWHVPKVVLAATLVAFGTSLPELVVGLTSVWKGHAEILVGNIIGADILNVLFVVGASATAAPLPIVERASAVPAILLYVHLPTMIVVLALFRAFIAAAAPRGRFRRGFGIPLVAIYVAYAVVQFVVSRP